jgi:hypothetical protein
VLVYQTALTFTSKINITRDMGQKAPLALSQLSWVGPLGAW